MMGNCVHIDQEEKRARQHSQEIDRNLVAMARQEENIVKILLLGEMKVLALKDEIYQILEEICMSKVRGQWT